MWALKHPAMLTAMTISVMAMVSFFISVDALIRPLMTRTVRSELDAAENMMSAVTPIADKRGRG
jgi:hypothetical protein